MDVHVTVTLPDHAANIDSEAVSRDVFEQVVAESYRSGRIGPVKVRKLLGFSSRIETEDFLHRRQAIVYTVEDLERDLKGMKDLGLL